MYWRTMNAFVERFRLRHIKFRVGHVTFWFFPFWWHDYAHVIGNGWRCLSWVRIPSKQQKYKRNRHHLGAGELSA